MQIGNRTPMARNMGRHQSRNGAAADSDAPDRSRDRRRPGRRAVLGASALLAVTGAGAGAGAVWYRHSQDDGEAQAASLVRALRTGDLRDAPLDTAQRDAATVRFTDTVGALRKDLGAPEIVLRSQEHSDDARSLHLSWTWDLGRGAKPWTYATTVDLTSGDDGWSASLPTSALVPGLEEGDRLGVRVDQPDMGRILDATGQQVYGPTPVIDVGIDKGSLHGHDEEDAAADLAKILRIDPATYRAKVKGNGPEAFVPALTIRERDAEGYDLDAAQKVPGCLQRSRHAPLAVQKNYAPGALGSLREATAEDIDKSNGALAPGDHVGSGGVCGAVGPTLLGTRGITITRTPARTSSPQALHEIPAVDGEDVEITLDPEFQRTATEILADTEAPSSICALRPSDGGLLAAALGPTGQEYPVGLVGQYAPGSTFKTVTALSMLRLGDTPDTVVECPATATIEGRSFKNADRMDPSLFGKMPLKDAIAHSCNTAMLLQYDRVDQKSFARSAESLGVGLRAPAGLDCFMGSVDPKDSGTEHVADMMGQGRVLTSPLAMTVVMASVLAGRTIHPQILAQPRGKVEKPESPLTKSEARTLRGMLHGVATYGGLKSTFGGYPGPPVYAKTGTAQWVDDGKIRLHSWVIVGQGNLAFSVFVEKGDYGSRTAAPLARRFLNAVRGR